MALIYPELSKRILGIAMQLHSEMGCGFKVAAEGAAAKVRTNLAEYLEKGIVK